MQNQVQKDLKHNVVFNICDGAFFGFAVGLASYTTIIPLFVATMTNSATLIGLIPAIHNMGWQLPQLLMAKRISKMEHIKPTVMMLTIHERAPIFFLALIGLLLPVIGSKIGLILTFAVLIWQGLGAGITANTWQIMITKIIPGDLRATFFGGQSAAANMLSSLGAVLAGVLLKRISPPWDFASCFFVASGLYVVSWFFLKQTREPINQLEIEPVPTQPLWQDVILILKTDKIFRNFLISRFVSQFGMMAYAFYTVFAVKHLGMNTITAGVMTSILLITQVLANPVLGRIADKWSRKWVLVLGSAISALSALLALLIKQPDLFVLVFIMMGIGNTAFWTIGLTISLEFGTKKQRPTYVGMANSLIAPSTILAPLLGGFLADSFSYSITFIVSAIFGVISMITLALLVKDPQRENHHKSNSTNLDSE
jgi:MFS family permease